MIVEKKTIERAKGKLGDKNALLIAQILSVEQFDTRNLKGLCPFHAEDTPSFIYNKKNYSMHCFGCGKTVDVLEAYMSVGHTFLEAVQFLFNQANIRYNFGEQGVKTRRAYRYPKPDKTDNKDQVYKYLAKRKISPRTVDYLDIQQDKNGNCVFNFYDTNDVLTMVKYRPSHRVDKSKKEAKTWCQTGADTTPLLFNMNRVNTTSPLLITEGELDCAAAIESGYSNAVSVPLGAHNYHWMEENWDWLEQFDSVILCADNDEAGNAMRKEVATRLGTWRTRFVEIPMDVDGHPIKDLNELLYYGGKEMVMDVILNAKETPVDSVIDFADIQAIDLSEMDGIKTGFPELDKALYKLFYGTLTIVTGINGCVSADTEYFNGTEWKPICEYTGEKVLQYNEDGTSTLVVPEVYHKYPCDRFFHIWSPEGIEQVVSADHNLVLFDKYKPCGKHILNMPLKVNALALVHSAYFGCADGYCLTDVGFAPYKNISSEIVPSSDGFKYCFTVPSGMLVLRHNGRINVTGNSGKSSFLSQLVCNCIEQGHNVFQYSGELPAFQQKTWINYILAGRYNVNRYQAGNTEYYKVNPTVQPQIDAFCREKLFIYKDGQSHKPDDLLNSMEASARKYGAKLFIIDNLTSLSMGSRERDRWDNQESFITRLIAFAVKYQVAPVLVVHPHKIETMRRLTKMDIQGAGGIIDLAHRIISLYRVQESDRQPDKKKGHIFEGDVVCDILKDRMRGYEGTSLEFFYDKPSRRFFTGYDDLYHQYPWDQEEHSREEDPIDVPQLDNRPI